jgi:antagonist of KipI
MQLAAEVEVIKSGILTTVQDLGRRGWQRYGVSVGGAADPLSHRLANLLVGNPEHAAALEMTLAGAELLTHSEIILAVCGADMNATVENVPLPMWRPVFVPRNRRILFRAATDGCRTILAIAGGIEVPEVLGSRSTSLRSGMGGIEGRALKSGDRLLIGFTKAHGSLGLVGPSNRTLPLLAGKAFIGEEWRSTNMKLTPDGACGIRVMPGCDWERYDDATRQQFLNAVYTVQAESDRMGARLSGPALTTKQEASMLSEAVTPGTIQVPLGGHPIALLADCQTTGGYPRIAQIAAVDLPVFAQLAPGRRVRFRLIGVSEAERLLLKRERNLRILSAGLALRQERLID